MWSQRLADARTNNGRRAPFIQVRLNQSTRSRYTRAPPRSIETYYRVAAGRVVTRYRDAFSRNVRIGPRLGTSAVRGATKRKHAAKQPDSNEISTAAAKECMRVEQWHHRNHLRSAYSECRCQRPLSSRPHHEQILSLYMSSFSLPRLSRDKCGRSSASTR